ncbi:MAG TPA: AGE family epimerase/isomerase [Sediminibacterium sp.]|nr:AGE family epimerase/isomerase [Sediminibacterium sp.]
MEELKQYQAEMEAELQSILGWWMEHTPDPGSAGFHGEVNASGIAHPGATRGLVLYSRILWTFSAAYRHTGNAHLLTMSEQAYRYLLNHFKDPVYGGMFWAVGADGKVQQDKKQVYGIVFCIYGLAEYYQAVKDEQALQVAIELFQLIETHCRDRVYDGYFEAFSRDWSPMPDVRLSEIDLNEQKSMNTHLHVLEAYSCLYKCRKDVKLASAIFSLLNLFRQHIIDAETHRQHLFFSASWEVRSNMVSFGHDVEAAWLLYEAAASVGNTEMLAYFKANAVEMAGVALRGVGPDGGMWYEYNKTGHHANKEKHWWPQAEAMVGFLNVYRLTGDEQYLRHSINSWSFIKKYIRDPQNGEWLWGIHENGSPMIREKAGFWKCPYHNSRACMEVSSIISVLLNRFPGL